MNIHVHAEFAYHIARGGVLMPCDGGFCIENPIVRDTGDYNAFYAYTFFDVASLNRQAQRQLEKMGYHESFHIHILDGNVPEGTPHTLGYHWISHGCEAVDGRLRRIHPGLDDYWAWYESNVRNYDDFTEDWWKSEKLSHGIFIAQFRPVWYLRGSEMVGSLYRYDTYSFTRLFSIVVEQHERGKGYGMEITSREVASSDVPVLIRSSPGLKNFYKKCGFRVEYTMAKVAQQGNPADTFGAAER